MNAIQYFGLLPVAYLTFYSFYWLFTTLLGLLYRPQRPELLTILMGVMARPKRPEAVNLVNPEMLLILPAYRPGPIFRKVLASVHQAIAGRPVQVYVLLQEADPAFYREASAYGFTVEERKFSHLPGNSYHHALHHIVDRIEGWQGAGTMNPQFAMLIDKDNVLSPDFFKYITASDYRQYDVIQAKRSSINPTGNVSFFDTISEGLNDTMFRAAKSLVRGTIEISGSGALIKTALFTETIRRLDSQAPGYDKNFMVQILTASYRVRTTYLPYIELYEEKTSDLESYNPQRMRWFGEQYYNALYSAGKLLTAFVRRQRFSALEYLVMLWRPPRSLQLLVVPMLGAAELVAYAWSGQWWLNFPYLVSSTIALVLSAVLFLIKEGLLISSLSHAASLPKLAINNARNASRSIKKENQGTFIHTEHKL